MNKLKNNRVGEIRRMNCGEECEIIKYINASDIYVKFKETNKEFRGNYEAFCGGKIKDTFLPTVCGVGYIGYETVKEDDKYLQSYKSWRQILIRGYDKTFKEKNKSYSDCLVWDEWSYYGDFKKWFNENYYEVEGEQMHIDKDILYKGNKIYSPKTCCYVPQRINTLFTKSNVLRGKYPIGVSYRKDINKFISRCSVFNNGKKQNVHLGRFKTPIEAFSAYKEFKENYIKQVADEYKDKIPIKLYEAMYNYIVEITD